MSETKPSQPGGRAARGPSGLKLWIFRGVALAVAFGALLVLDRIAGLLGLPSEDPWHPVAPPHYRTEVDQVDYGYTLQANDRGIRYRSVPLAKPPGTSRVVLLGDSFTEGTGVSDPERWAEIAEAGLREGGMPGVELINCGEAGTNTFHQARVLRHLALDYEPDAVVVGLFHNDVADARVPFHAAEVTASRPPSPERTGLRRVAHALLPRGYTALRLALGGTARGQQDIRTRVRDEASRRGLSSETVERLLEAVPTEVTEAVDHGRLNGTVITYPLTRPEHYHGSLDLKTPAFRARFEATCAALEWIRTTSDERGIPMGLVYFPSVYEHDPASGQRLRARLYALMERPMREEWRQGPTTLEAELEAWARSRGVDFLSLGPTLRAASSEAGVELTHGLDDHWTAAGHRLVAGEIERWLRAGVLAGPLR